MPAMRLSSSFKRSSIAADRPHFGAGFHVQALALLMAAAFCLQRIGHGEQAGVFLGGRQFRQFARGGLRLPGQLRHLFRQRHKSNVR